MAYTVLGVLYNRFVLQLRGFDQIPQFSVESMNYHGARLGIGLKICGLL